MQYTIHHYYTSHAGDAEEAEEVVKPNEDRLQDEDDEIEDNEMQDDINQIEEDITFEEERNTASIRPNQTPDVDITQGIH